MSPVDAESEHDKVAGLARPDALVEIDALAVLPEYDS